MWWGEGTLGRTGCWLLTYLAPCPTGCMCVWPGGSSLRSVPVSYLCCQSSSCRCVRLAYLRTTLPSGRFSSAEYYHVSFTNNPRSGPRPPGHHLPHPCPPRVCRVGKEVRWLHSLMSAPAVDWGAQRRESEHGPPRTLGRRMGLSSGYINPIAHPRREGLSEGQRMDATIWFPGFPSTLPTAEASRVS